MADVGRELLQMVFQVRRGRDKDERVIFSGNLVDVRSEVDVVSVEVYTCEIGRIMSEPSEVSKNERLKLITNKIKDGHVKGRFIAKFLKFQDRHFMTI